MERKHNWNRLAKENEEKNDHGTLTSKWSTLCKDIRTSNVREKSRTHP
jgi:hypothetical protein